MFFSKLSLVEIIQVITTYLLFLCPRTTNTWCKLRTPILNDIWLLMLILYTCDACSDISSDVNVSVEVVVFYLAMLNIRFSIVERNGRVFGNKELVLFFVWYLTTVNSRCVMDENLIATALELQPKVNYCCNAINNLSRPTNVSTTSNCLQQYLYPGFLT